MRRIAKIIPVLAAAMMITAMPVRADEGSMDKMSSGAKAQKNECLLVAMNCANQVDSIQQRIDRLNKEIGRGTDVYTRDELRRLEDKLDDAHRTLDSIEFSGGA